MDAVDLDAYGRDYCPEPGARVADGAIRSGDRHVGAHDPLRAVAIASCGAAADVQLGVDPGRFYCADQFANLIEIGAELAIPVGFIHVPPDRSTGAVAAGAGHLYARSAGAEQCARVLATALRGMFEETYDGTVVVTGFGPFVGVADNPTAAFVGDDRGLEGMMRRALPEMRIEASEAVADARGAVLGVRRGRTQPRGRCRTASPRSRRCTPA